MYDIFFLSYDEPNGEHNWSLLKSRFKRTKRVHGVTGILNAHKACAKKSLTKYFFVVDGDSEIIGDFSFRLSNELESELKNHTDAIWVWRAKNPVNELEYGYGGVKLLPKKLLMDMPEMAVDMTTSLGSNFKIVNQVASITHFNSSPFNAWRGAFRECVKLSSSIIPRHKQEETEYRLWAWKNNNTGVLYGDWAIRGAREGEHFGNKYKHETKKLAKINNFQWLKDRFEENQANL